MPSLLARFAENYFWMARYIERAENLARILDVNETYAGSSGGVDEWLPIVQLHDDGARFFARHEAATADAVIRFYVLERDNPSSIIAGVRAARENARTLRHLISTEAWVQLNVFYNRLQDLTSADLALSQVSRLCATIKEDCQLHTGIIEGTLYRDQGWFFHQLGQQVERADATTRILDITYHRLLPAEADLALPVDASQWNALLRSVAGYQAFRRVHHRGLQPTKVAAFLLFDQGFPRSIVSCLRGVDEVFAALSALPELCGVAEPAHSLEALRRTGEDRIDDVLRSGLHAYLDGIQGDLIAFTDDLSRMFFHRAS